ncbi:OmpW/AlkL family protein [Marinobacter pelagius]|uniref:OmpW family protein n=1 Tax=Marinobacter pelagius TaxID=379482 RepID=A0A1I4TKA4_9GAMM|nr:OmpW family outer membrane protein [Marinobacter pelagius]SFM77154.1 OmpW family protein [Marinobacter pelagius]
MKGFSATNLASAAVVSLLGGALAGPVQAGAGDFYVRAGVSAMDPDTGSESFSTIPRSGVRLDSDVTLGGALGWFVTESVALEVSSSLPYSPDLEGNQRLKDLGIGNIGDVKYVPTYLTMNFFFQDTSAVTPYLGAGVAFNKFYDENAKLSGLDVNLDSTFDPTVLAGVELDFGTPVLVNFDVRYTLLDTDAKFSGAIDETVEMEIDPVVFTLGVGYRF